MVSGCILRLFEGPHALSAIEGEERTSAKLKLAVGAIGIVFGDIGTSPLYAFRETFVGPHKLTIDDAHILGVVSLIFWSMTLIVSIQYVSILMRADNKGQGGTLALVTLISRHIGQSRWHWYTLMLAVFATALFFGDCMITPAVSVLSAVEGLTVVQRGLGPFVIPIALVLLVALFFLQRRGTAKVGALFAPIMVLYFVTIAVLGVFHIVQAPGVLTALNPWYAVQFFMLDGWLAFLALGSVVLAVTGSEALYSDMGHFGRGPMRLSWFGFVMPCLLLNYFGQGAMIVGLGDAAAAEAIRNPFFVMAPEVLRLPLVLLATAATFIASQAVITGAFSITHQAVQLGYIPRLTIQHTSQQHQGQIYIPLVNWTLCIAVILLVLFFRNSSNLASAYGIAVTGAMLIDTCLMAVLLVAVWKWKWYFWVPVALLFLIVDGAYFLANATKIPSGGWFPLLVGGVAFIMLTTWSKGRRLMRARMAEVSLPLDIFAKSARNSTARVPGTAIFMHSGASGTPSALLHNIKHNKVLHERVVVLTVQIAEVPFVDDAERFDITEHGDGFYSVQLRYGFMQETDVPAALKAIGRARKGPDYVEPAPQKIEIGGGPFEMIQTSFFLSRQTLLSAESPGMAVWRERLFAWMMRNAATPMQFFNLPTNRVVELGSQVEI